MRAYPFITKQLVKALLESADRHEWTVQGLGMLRTYLSEETRLHIWTDEFKAPSVSTLHTHPWDFESVVVTGVVENKRYTIAKEGADKDALRPLTHMRQTIRCGEGGGLIGEPEEITLLPYPTEVFGAGDSYSQAAEEIHESSPQPGTITIIQREFRPDTEHAYVFWPVGEEWVTAEPRSATDEEIAAGVGAALERL